MNLETWTVLFSFRLSMSSLHTHVCAHEQQSERKCDYSFYLSTLLLLMVVSRANLQRSQEKDKFK